MKIAFLVHRTNYFKLFGPVIDEAIRRGHEVEIWIYQAPMYGSKAYLRPNPESLPIFVGQTKLREFRDPRGIYNLASKVGVEVLFSLHPKSFYTKREYGNIRLITLQHGIDTFVETGPAELGTADMLCLYSPYWLDWACKYYNRKLDIPESEIRKELQNRVRFIGLPEMDVLKTLYRKKALCKKLGIPANKKVVLLLPFPFTNMKKEWSHFFGAPNRIRQFYYLIRGAQKEGLGFAIKYWKWVLFGWNERSLIRAMKKFALVNDAVLVVKGRKKDPLRPWVRENADLVFYDEDYYPATIIELLAVANLCIEFYSFATLEAAYCGVPSLTLDRPSPHVSLLEKPLLHHMLWRSKENGSAFNYPGVAYWKTIPEVIVRLPKLQMKDFALHKRDLKRYLTTFIGPSDFTASQKIFDLLPEI